MGKGCCAPCERETSRTRAACTYARHACAPADLPAHLSLGFFARRSRTRTEGVVVSGGQSRSGRDRWASRTRRIAPADVEGWISLSGQRGVSCGCGTARKHASVCAILEAGQCGRVRDVVAAATSRACAQRRSRVAPGRRVPARGARTSAHPPGGQRRELAQKGDFLRAVRAHTTTSPSVVCQSLTEPRSHKQHAGQAGAGLMGHSLKRGPWTAGSSASPRR